MKQMLPFILLTAVLIIGCDSRPQGVLSRSKMEDVLYDYHLAQGMIDQMPTDERIERAQDCINAVYAKHGITEAQFDKSIAHYNRKTKDLHHIYRNLKDRYSALNEELKLVNGNNDMMAVFAAGGDTTNLWSASPLVVLRNQSLLNKESFTIHADTTFRRHDQFIFTITPIFFRETPDNYDIDLSIGLSIYYANGKYTGTTRAVRENRTQQLTLKAEDDADIQKITGFLYYNGKKGTRNMCLVNNISLVRMHEKTAEPEAAPLPATDTQPTDTIGADTLSIDSIDTDTLPAHRRMTPEELRQQNKSGKQIRIEKAPSVRKPNTLGPRRKAIKK